MARVRTADPTWDSSPSEAQLSLGAKVQFYLNIVIESGKEPRGAMVMAGVPVKWHVSLASCKIPRLKKIE